MESIIIACKDVDYNIRVQNRMVMFGYIVSKDGTATYCTGEEMRHIINALKTVLNKHGENDEIISTLNNLITG